MIISPGRLLNLLSLFFLVVSASASTAPLLLQLRKACPPDLYRSEQLAYRGFLHGVSQLPMGFNFKSVLTSSSSASAMIFRCGTFQSRWMEYKG